MKNDRSFLRRAIIIAGENIKSGGGPFGAVVTREGKIISEASNRVVLSKDPTAHAEILAIRDAALYLKSHILEGCTLYSSCEPCPMCLGAIYWSGIKKVVYASDRKEAEKAGFSDKMIYDEISIEPGDRKIQFVRITDAGGDEVFREWNETEDKITY